MASRIKKTVFSFLLLLCCIHVSFSQQNVIHDKINTDIYNTFSKAYQTLDYALFASIHSKKMIRIAGDGGTIKNATEYLKGYEKRWSDPKRTPASIDFRLFERIVSDSLVSDRGIYKVSYKDSLQNVRHSYGQFHVLLRLINKSWKITIDYDSNEKNTINEKSYLNAFALSDHTKYSKTKH